VAAGVDGLEVAAVMAVPFTSRVGEVTGKTRHRGDLFLKVIQAIVALKAHALRAWPTPERGWAFGAIPLLTICTGYNPGMWIAVILLSMACPALAGLSLWLYAGRAPLRAERDRLAGELADSRKRADRLDQENRDLHSQVTTARATAQQMREQHEDAQKQAQATFTALASDTLAKVNAQYRGEFLALARKTFEGEQKDAAAQLEQRKQAIDNLLKPVSQALEKYNLAVQQIENARQQAYGSLKQHLEGLRGDQDRLRAETGNLVKALRQPQVRGRWGEVQLKRVVELAGMIGRCDFDEQVTVKAIDNVQRPDLIVHLPGGGVVVVDAKTPIAAYIEAIECQEDEPRLQCLQRHVSHIEQKVRDLSAKRYQDQFERSPDFVVLFIPGESFLQAAALVRSDLIEWAMNQSVVIATPTTLIALLKAVASGWREEKIAENAQRVSELGRELHERLATATEHVDKLGRALESAVKAYNGFVGSYESRVLSSARKLKEMGADSMKELPAEGALHQVELQPREIKAGA
jgi:DNA recombination protein RmuC